MQYSGTCSEYFCGKTFLIMSSGGVGSRMTHADQHLPSRKSLSPETPKCSNLGFEFSSLFSIAAVSTKFFSSCYSSSPLFSHQAIRSFPASDLFTSIFVIFTMRIFSRRYLSQTVDQRHGDIPLFVCCFTSGLLDSVSFNNWGVFVGMQTGT